MLNSGRRAGGCQPSGNGRAEFTTGAGGGASRQAVATASFPALGKRGSFHRFTPPMLTTPIESRPLRANPSHPLLWNSGTSNGGSAQVSVSRQNRGGHLGTNPSSSLSSPRSSTASISGTNEGSSAQRGNDRSSTVGAAVFPMCTSTTQGGSRQRPPLGGALASSWPANGDGGAASPVQHNKLKRVAAVNYNALFYQEQEALLQQQQGSSIPAFASAQASPALFPAPPTGGQRRPSRESGLQSSAAGVHPTAVEANAVPPPMLTTTASSSGLSLLSSAGEGPLPPEVRRLITQSCTTDGGGSNASTDATVDAMEQQARRLISTGRRLKVYREELTTAEEERRDLSATVEQHQLVRSVLQKEVDDLNARIQELLQERALCETQLRAQDETAAREARKLNEAHERVTALRKTIDDAVEETMVARLMLRHQVPSLHIENYY